jgi:hypothetical protein
MMPWLKVSMMPWLKVSLTPWLKVSLMPWLKILLTPWLEISLMPWEETSAGHRVHYEPSHLLMPGAHPFLRSCPTILATLRPHG